MPMQPSRLAHFSGPLALGLVYEVHSHVYMLFHAPQSLSPNDLSCRAPGLGFDMLHSVG